MNKLFKLLILLLIIEVSLGYFKYLKDTTIINGYYVSSTIKALVKLKKIIINYKKDDTSLTNKVIIGTERKKIKRKFECEKILQDNQSVELTGVISYRVPINFQTNIEFLKEIDPDKDYLVVVMGNSEANGVNQKGIDRMHVVLQKKFREKFKSKNIYVVNLGNVAGYISDHLTDLINFSRVHKPDLVIFYTGGNELSYEEHFEQILESRKGVSLNTENYKWYTFLNKGFSRDDENLDINYENIAACLQNDIFITKHNYNETKFFPNLENYIKKNYYRISNSLNNNKIDFIFYIQPFNKEMDYSKKAKNYDLLSNIELHDEKFVNLNLSKENFKLNFVDSFHTRSTHTISNTIFNDILKNYENKIVTKINKKNN